MQGQACDLAHRLARDAEAVCRHYLSNGRREGAYWLVGDATNAPGRSLYVRLRGPESPELRRGRFRAPDALIASLLADVSVAETKIRPPTSAPPR